MHSNWPPIVLLGEPAVATAARLYQRQCKPPTAAYRVFGLYALNDDDAVVVLATNTAGPTDSLVVRDSIIYFSALCHRASVCPSVRHTGGSVKNG